MGQDKPKAEKQSVILLLIGDIASTTWRMFVPTILGALGGLWLDQKFSTPPWFAITGIVLGIVITGVLISQQYKNIR